MATLSVQDIVPGGLEAAFAAAAGGGDTFFDDGRQRTFLEVVNGGGGDITVTIDAKTTAKKVGGVGAIAIADQQVTVTAGERRHIGPFTEAFRDTDGTVDIAYSGVTSVTVAVLRLPEADH